MVVGRWLFVKACKESHIITKEWKAPEFQETKYIGVVDEGQKGVEAMEDLQL